MESDTVVEEELGLDEWLLQSPPCETRRWPSPHEDARWRAWARCPNCSYRVKKHICTPCKELLTTVQMYCSMCLYEDEAQVFYYKVEPF